MGGVDNMASRRPINKYSGIRSIWPIFLWVECDLCGNEFRREKMYAVPTRFYPRIIYRHSCSNCSCSKEDAFEKVLLKRNSCRPKHRPLRE